MGRGASVFPLLPCGKCSACQEEQYARCSSYDYYGSRRDGAMAEYLAVKKENLCLLPEGVSYEEAAMSEPAAVALHAFCRSGLGQGDTLLIYGIGTIGLIVAQWAKAAGVKNIILAAGRMTRWSLPGNWDFPWQSMRKRIVLANLWRK